jgi:predicted nuclease with TOPRIM domain
MIDSIMLVLIGVFIGGLVAVAFAPSVHSRAVRLTTRRLRARLPESTRQIQAQKDLLRADFAISMRRLEITVAELRNKLAKLMVELSQKSDTLYRLNGERDALKGEVVVLKGQVETLKEQNATATEPAKTGKEIVKKMRLLGPLSIH